MRAAEDFLPDNILDAEVDRLIPFNTAILVVRWTTTVACLALAVPHLANKTPWTLTFWVVVLVSYTAIRTVSPIVYSENLTSLMMVLGEVLLLTVAVVSTGLWLSPFIFALASAIVVAAFARGFSFGIRIAITTTLIVAIPDALRNDFVWPTDAQSSLQWAVLLTLVAVVAGYGRVISGEANAARSVALDRLTRLADANAMLFSLHRVAQSLPASLDYEEVLDSTVARLRGLLDFDSAAILIADDTDGSWTVARREGVRLPERIYRTDMPITLLNAAKTKEIVVRNRLSNARPGLTPTMGSGIYAPLMARNSLVGLVSLEHAEEAHFTNRDVELMVGFVEPVALAIDNARWFHRLRTMGADEERTRIARDLHDRIGQSLAYLAFELDRIKSSNSKGNDVTTALDHLRNDLRNVIGEVRDTLYDLRTDVSENNDIASTLDQFIQRVNERSGIEIALHADRDKRLPIMQEREMWRIAQESLINVERHANAKSAQVLWRCNGKAAALEISDDGNGFPVGKAGRLDSYGIMGMRERAASIGATLDVISGVGEGTKIRCYLAPK